MNEEKYLEVAISVAREVGDFLRQHLTDKKKEVNYKGEIDLVTVRDLEAQERIISRLKENFPHHDILAEEEINQDQERKSEFRWIIDPLDGTTNYAHSYPVFCVSLALEVKGEVILGVVYDPNLQECFTAVKGQGARCNGQPLRVSTVAELDKSLLATGFPYDVRVSDINNIDHFVNFLRQAQAIRRCGSAAIDLCYVACGRFDGFWELKLNPWDIAAGALLVREAGGRVSDFGGERLNIYGREIVASNGRIHEEMIRVLKKGKRP
jgi:myo-inositol-1(or 4)-monophosphatase